jgi:hypothetical protein
MNTEIKKIITVLVVCMLVLSVFLGWDAHQIYDNFTVLRAEKTASSRK